MDADLLAPKPAALSMVEAAALPLSVITAWEGLVDRAGVRPGQRVLVLFDTVGGTALDDAFASVRRYTGHVVSILGWGSHSLAPLSFRGASYSGVFTLLPLLTGEGRARHGDVLREAAALADAGALTPIVHPRVYDRGTVAEAYDVVGSGRPQGKVVIALL